MVANQYSKNWDKSIKYAGNLFESFLSTKQILSSDSLDKSEISHFLSIFWPSVRKTNGELFKTGSLYVMRQGLCSYLKEKFNIDILKDETFNKSNHIFKMQTKESKKNGKGDVSHFKNLSQSDLEKVVNNLHPNVPFHLQLLTFFYIMLYFARRGRENLAEMTKCFVIFKTNEKGERYVVKSRDELTKNHRESDTRKIEGGRIYETNSEKCPVKIISSYLAKLNPNCNFLWQKPKINICEGECWFENKKIGKNTLGNFMKSISKICNLSEIYTNHCLRSTVCTILGEQGFSDISIKAISGHRSISALSIYKRPQEQEVANMSKSISDFIGVSDSDEIAKYDDSTKQINLTSSDIDFDFDSEFSNLVEQVEKKKSPISKSMHFSGCSFNNCTFN